MALKLIELTADYKQALAEMVEEWRLHQERYQTNHSPWVIFKYDHEDFENYLNQLAQEAQAEVPGSVFFLLDEAEDRLLGAVHLRHRLNAELLALGGHIGYGIRPSERCKGYASQLLALTLEKCQQLGLRRVMISCDKSNLASAKVIIKNGGQLENEVVDAKGVLKQRYWVTFKPEA